LLLGFYKLFQRLLTLSRMLQLLLQLLLLLLILLLLLLLILLLLLLLLLQLMLLIKLLRDLLLLLVGRMHRHHHGHRRDERHGTRRVHSKERGNRRRHDCAPVHFKGNGKLVLHLRQRTGMYFSHLPYKTIFFYSVYRSRDSIPESKTPRPAACGA